MEKAILLALHEKKNRLFDYYLAEMKDLIEAADFSLCETFIQQSDVMNNPMYFGSGKLREIKAYLEVTDIKTVITMDALTPSQIAKMNEYLNIEIIDRNMLILKIFEARSTTKESTLQVKIAKLKYMLPRLSGSYDYMNRQAGASGSMSSRGSGEKQITLDRQHIESQINHYQKELAEYISHRNEIKKQRINNQEKIVALVGYTNSGKSTTMNNLISRYSTFSDNADKQVLAKDQLFATLSTTTRKVVLENNHDFLLIDTVGFVSNLPHHLFDSFKSTLEEVNDADVIIHMIDISNPFYLDQVNTTLDVLKQLNVNKPIINCFNKIDLYQEDILPRLYDNNEYVYISNNTLEGMDKLIELIDKSLYGNYHQVKLLIPYSEGKIIDQLKTNCKVNNLTYLEDGYLIDVELSDYLFNLYKNYITK